MVQERFIEILNNNRGPKEIKNTLYKYRNWNTECEKNINHQNVLYNPELYLSSIKDFADIEDFQFYLRYDLLSFNQLVQKGYNIISQEYFYAQMNLLFALENNNLLKISECKKILKNTKPLIENTYLRLEKALLVANEKYVRYRDYQNVLKDNLEFFRDPTIKTYGVCSLCTNPDVSRMWLEYSNNFTGYCIGFNTDFFKHIDFTPTVLPVIYYEEYPIILPLNNTNEIERSLDELYLSACLKKREFEFESEYRVLVHNGVHKTITIPQKFVSEIYIGYKMLKSDQEEIIQYSERYYPQAKLYHVNEVGGQLEISQITIKRSQ